MKSKDVQIKTGLTRKAIEYYESLGLITPSRTENGYRNYSKEDISKLSRIGMYRKLGLNISEISQVLVSEDRKKIISNIIRDREIHKKIDNKKLNLLRRFLEGSLLEDGYSSFSEIEEELFSIEAQKSIYECLSDKFPGYLGQMFFLNYAPFLQGRLQTDEQKEAFSQLVVFLDNLKNPPFTEEEKQILINVPEEITVEMIESSVEDKINALNNIDNWMEENREIIEQYQNFKNSDEYQSLPIVHIYEKMKTFFQESGYYEVAIPLIRKMSPDYDSYYLKLMDVNEHFVKKLNP